MHEKIRLRSHLVPEYGARERFLMGTNVNTHFFQVPTPGLDSGTELGINISGTYCLNTAPFCAGARAQVFGHQV